MTRDFPPEHEKSLMALAGDRLLQSGREDLVPCGYAGRGQGQAPPNELLPKSLTELIDTDVRSFELTVTAAASLNIPVAGSVSGGYNRRIIVLEQYAVKPIEYDNVRYDYGYAVRFCVTVNNWSANLKISLPFLAASAEIGAISAQWLMQVLGLTGPKITAALPPPTELNVEKFVLAKQKLEQIIAAIQDSSTVFTAAMVHRVDPELIQAARLRSAVAQAYALTSIGRNRSLVEALERLQGNEEPASDDAIREVYAGFAGLDGAIKPSPQVRYKAQEILGKISADV